MVGLAVCISACISKLTSTPVVKDQALLTAYILSKSPPSYLVAYRVVDTTSKGCQACQLALIICRSVAVWDGVTGSKLLLLWLKTSRAARAFSFSSSSFSVYMRSNTEKQRGPRCSIFGCVLEGNLRLYCRRSPAGLRHKLLRPDLS